MSAVHKHIGYFCFIAGASFGSCTSQEYEVGTEQAEKQTVVDAYTHERIASCHSPEMGNIKVTLGGNSLLSVRSQYEGEGWDRDGKSGLIFSNAVGRARSCHEENTKGLLFSLVNNPAFSGTNQPIQVLLESSLNADSMVIKLETNPQYPGQDLLSWTCSNLEWDRIEKAFQSLGLTPQDDCQTRI